ncbi:MAG: hypothetical protein P8123_04800, partial [bacterium]
MRIVKVISLRCQHPAPKGSLRERGPFGTGCCANLPSKRIALRLHGRPAQRFNSSKLGGYSVASGVAYLVEADCFDSQDDAGARC